MKTGARTVVLWCLVFVFPLVVSSLHADWEEYGVPVCIAPNDQFGPVVMPDEAGGVIVAWTDYRSGIGISNIYAQRINADGDTLWAANGIGLCDAADNKSYPAMVPDGTGGAVVIWRDRRDPANGYDVYAQRINGSGTRMWSGDGAAICDTLADQVYPQIASDGAGGAIVVWQDYRESGIKLYAQRIGTDGTVLWERNGIAIDLTDTNPISQKIISDGVGGAIITWEQFGRTVAQRVAADGDTLWQANGIHVCTPDLEQNNPDLTTDGAGGAIIAWIDKRTPGEQYIYAQRVDAGGDTLWTADGVPLCKVTNYQWQPHIVSDGSGGAIIVWGEGLTNQEDLHAQRVDGNGNLLWSANGVDVCTAPNRQLFNLVASDGGGGAVIHWEDERGAFPASYAQRLDGDGNPLWNADGVTIGNRLTNDFTATLLPGGGVGAYFVWEGYSLTTDMDIYISLVDENGHIVPTRLRSYGVDYRDGTVVVEWTLSSATSRESFTVLRKETTLQRNWVEIPVEIEIQDESYFFADKTCIPGSSYRYRVDVTDETGRKELFETEVTAVPAAAVRLFQNTPNPFNRSTEVRYYVPRASEVTLTVYDTAGRLVARLVDGTPKAAGAHLAGWDGRDVNGRPIASGVYFYRLQAGKLSKNRKMVLIR
jgi:hypothetical protein